jgi:hypothetical protein
MVEVLGTTPGETKQRVVEISKDGSKVSIWIHPPYSPETSGWQVLVGLNELRAALIREAIVEAA